MNSSSDSAPALDISGLSHAFGANKVLNDVGLSVDGGTFCVLLGLNGAGKTTLFSLITRLYHNNTGSIRVFGHDVRTQSSQAMRRLGVVFQQRTLDLDLSVEQNLKYHAALHGLPRRNIGERIVEVLETVELAERKGDKARSLSGGQIRRVEIARCLLHRPKLLLLDEATVGLDIGSRQTIIGHVRKLCREQGIGVLWATHLIDEVEPGDQVAVLHKGVILADGREDEVSANAGAATIREAFQTLTGIGGAP